MHTHETASYRESNRATAQLALWTLAWSVTLAAAKFGPEVVWNEQRVASWAAVAVNLLVGIAWIVTFARLLRALDDLQRKIMQDALAVTLGVGWVVGFAYSVADAAGLVTRDLNIALFPAILGVVYVIAFAVGRLRYQ
ncbi:hypothetical protein E1212_08335 [Jiangella ureilytica]|uniref:Uncharacterized protein n=1 Tax=Jiangella ureilytica TaxID=2530374 RepID=A0A4R4RRI6_9ACTN|nr:hypothetical protein [Jiangella ureilytica]TDC52591.1 hypothetical protein E1212_08335 [Jiangella ureilytica]